MQELSAREAAALLRESPDNTLLLDVREDIELAMARVEPALHIPMAQVPGRLEEIPRDCTVVCMCHHGGRSAQVAGYLEAQGYSGVINLAGGIDAWSTDVDESIARYEHKEPDQRESGILPNRGAESVLRYVTN